MNKRFLQQKKFFQHKLNISTSNKLSCLSYTLAVNMMNFKLRQALSSKITKSNDKNFNLNSGSYMIPHYKKKHTGGEDSYLVFEDLVMVADGVGGWAGKGIDPGLFSRELRDKIKEEYEKRMNYYIDEIEIKSSLVEAVKKTKSKGSSTIVLLLLNQETKKLHATYVGDSLYMILRYNQNYEKFECIYKSNEQQHKFNQPFQVGTNGDSPNLAVIESHDIQDKDIVIVASDGLWDNVYDDNLISIINEKTKDNNGNVLDSDELACLIANVAEKNSLDVSYDSPFSKRARSKGFDYYGGKEDDITVVITQMNQVKKENNYFNVEKSLKENIV